LIQPAFRERFKHEPEATYDEADLTNAERDMINRRDWQAMIHYVLHQPVSLPAQRRRYATNPITISLPNVRRHCLAIGNVGIVISQTP